MKRKVAFAMAASLTMASIFGSTSLFAQEATEAIPEMAESVEVPETETVEPLGENETEAVEDMTACTEAETAAVASADEEFEDEIIEDMGADFIEFPQQPELPETEEINEGQDTSAEDLVEADEELSVDLTSDAAEWIEAAPSEEADVTADGSEIVATLDESCFPDKNFLKYIERYDEDNDGKLSQTEADEVEIIRFSDEYDITNLKGIEYFRNLQTLECGYNTLMTLDISKNTALVFLNCNCQLWM